MYIYVIKYLSLSQKNCPSNQKRFYEVEIIRQNVKIMILHAELNCTLKT